MIHTGTYKEDKNLDFAKAVFENISNMNPEFIPWEFRRYRKKNNQPQQKLKTA